MPLFHCSAVLSVCSMWLPAFSFPWPLSRLYHPASSLEGRIPLRLCRLLFNRTIPNAHIYKHLKFLQITLTANKRDTLYTASSQWDAAKLDFKRQAPVSKLSSKWLCACSFCLSSPHSGERAKADLEGLLHKEKSVQGTIPGQTRGDGLAEDSGKTELGVPLNKLMSSHSEPSPLQTGLSADTGVSHSFPWLSKAYLSSEALDEAVHKYLTVVKYKTKQKTIPQKPNQNQL